MAKLEASSRDPQSSDVGMEAQEQELASLKQNYVQVYAAYNDTAAKVGQLEADKAALESNITQLNAELGQLRETAGVCTVGNICRITGIGHVISSNIIH